MNRFLKVLRWFYPGLKIKRWIFLLLIGMVSIFLSSQFVSKTPHFIAKMISNILFIVGTGAIIVGIAYLIKSFFEAIYPHRETCRADPVR